MIGLKRALYADHPLELLSTVSAMVTLTEPEPGRPGSHGQSVTLADLVESFLEIDIAPTTAVLHVLAAYLGEDELLTARIRRELRLRQQPMPAWLPRLAETTVAAVHESREILRDGEDYFLLVNLPDGHTMTAVVYVDNNLGQVVKDAFVVTEPFEVIAEHFASEPDLEVSEVDPAWARARMEQAVKIGAITVPPLTSENWPAVRPLIRWLLRLLPEGGELDEWTGWSEEQESALVEDFLASPEGSGFDDADHRSLLSDLMWFGTGYGTGDPLRWSAVNVEVLLVDWFPRKVVADVQLLEKLPELLRGFIRYAHTTRSIPRRLTVEVLAAVDRWEPEYQRLIRTDRPQGAEALALSLLDYLDSESLRHRAESAVGGPGALASLDDQPLPDEPFDWSGIPDDVTDKVEEVLALCDENADRFLDREHRTANRRLLRSVALADPSFFRGRAAARTSAAAICYLVAHANGSTSPYGPLTMQELLGPFAAGAASQRAKRVREVLGLDVEPPGAHPISLASPEYLVAARRSELIRDRDD
jgi:hypothetical protein